MHKLMELRIDQLKGTFVNLLVLGCFMPTSLYLTALNRPNGLDYQKSSICSIPLALEIEDGCRQILTGLNSKSQQSGLIIAYCVIF